MPQSTVSACGETCAGVMAAFFGLPTVRRDSLWSGCVCFVMASLRLEYSTFMLFTFVLGCIRVTNGFCFAKLENCRVLRMAHESSFMCCKNFHHVFVMSYNRSPKKKSGNPCFIFPVSFFFQTRAAVCALICWPSCFQYLVPSSSWVLRNAKLWLASDQLVVCAVSAKAQQEIMTCFWLNRQCDHPVRQNIVLSAGSIWSRWTQKMKLGSFVADQKT